MAALKDAALNTLSSTRKKLNPSLCMIFNMRCTEMTVGQN